MSRPSVGRVSKSKKIANEAEAWFARCLTERGYAFEYEPDLQIDRRPDFLVHVDGVRIAAEVKAFDPHAEADELMKYYRAVQAGEAPPTRTRKLEDVLKPMRNQIHAAAKQLRGLRDRAMPLVVVLANPGSRLVPVTEPAMVVSAMYGDLGLEAPLLPGGHVGEFRTVMQRNGKLTNDHPYISAVVVVRRELRAERWAHDWFSTHQGEFAPDDLAGVLSALKAASVDAPDGDELFMDVYETVSTGAVPLPRHVFNGPGDRRWIPDKTQTALVQLEADPA